MTDHTRALRTLAKELGLSDQVTSTMVVAKVIAMRDELAALKTQSNRRKRERDGDSSGDSDGGAAVLASQPSDPSGDSDGGAVVLASQPKKSLSFVEFWRWIDGEPRDLMALVFNTWVRVEVVEVIGVRKRKCPVLVKIKEGEHAGKRYYMPKHQDCFREVAPWNLGLS